MSSDIRVGMRLTADSKGFVGGVTVSDRALRRFSGGTDKAAASARRLARNTGS